MSLLYEISYDIANMKVFETLIMVERKEYRHTLKNHLMSTKQP